MIFMKKSKKAHLLTDAEFAELKEGAIDALAHARKQKFALRQQSIQSLPKRPLLSPKRIKSIRDRLNMSQPVFAQLLYVSKDTTAKWEQGITKPSGSALRLLQILERHPELVFESTDFASVFDDRAAR